MRADIIALCQLYYYCHAKLAKRVLVRWTSLKHMPHNKTVREERISVQHVNPPVFVCLLALYVVIVSILTLRWHYL